MTSTWRVVTHHTTRSKSLGLELAVTIDKVVTHRQKADVRVEMAAAPNKGEECFR